MPLDNWSGQIPLLFYSIYWILLLTSCTNFDSLGSLTVTPSVPFLMGSNLTLFCHINKCPYLSHIYLEIGKETVLPGNFDKCTAIFSLTNVREPLSIAYCKKQDNGVDYYVTGITLRSGLPPDKPLNISCETTRNAHFVDCKWKKGKETHEPTAYNISVNLENGSLVYSHKVQDIDNCSIPQQTFDKNSTYQLTVFAHNHFGKSQSDPLTFSFSDIVVPEMPHITHIEFNNDSLVAVLRWKTNESSVNLKPYIRMHTANGHREEGEVLEIGAGLVHVTGLRPFTDYHFQVKTCTKQFQQTEINPHTSGKKVCSKWSPSFLKKTPGKGPSQPLHVWRDSVITMKNGQQMVTVFWKPPPAHDYSGEIHRYEVLLGDGQKQEHSCAPSSQCFASVPLLQPISVTAVTSFGTSPPATVPLTQSDAPGAVLAEVTPSVNGSAVTVFWTRLEQKEELLNYVTEWTALPPTALHWKTVSKKHRYTTVTGLMPGVQYNISVYAVTTRGACAPSSSVIYSKQLKPLSGPGVSVSVHLPNKVLVMWDELPVEQRRGFITSYTIYYHVLDSNSSKLSVSVPASGPRQRWLDCPEGTLALQMTASTAAGEGPRGNLYSSHPPAPPVGLVVVIVFIITFFIAIIVNLMCWKCVRKRIKQKCIAWGPEWLGDNLPKLKNSTAIKLLELDKSEPSLYSSFSDPPLSPISFARLQDDGEELYPSVLVETAPLQPESTLLLPESTNDIYNPSINMDHVNYKPQTGFLFPENEEVEVTEESSDQFEGFVKELLFNIRVDVNNSQTGLNLDTVQCPLGSKTFESNVAAMEKWTDKTDCKPNLLLVELGDDSSEALVDFFDHVDRSLANGYFPQITSLK